jgi:hypothetical protein
MTEEGGAGKSEDRSPIRELSETVRDAAHQVRESLEAGGRPASSLDILSSWTREAPLHSLMIAFLLGFIVGRR